MAVDIELADVDRILCSRPGGFYHFVRLAWPVVEPARPFQDNWHIGAISDHLEAVFRREIKRLVINVPPGTMKSLLTSVFWPAWSWTQSPSEKWISSSFSATIARRDSLRSRQLMESPWSQQRWGDLWRKNEDVWSATQFRNDRAGFRVSTTVAGSITGEHADHQFVDDPIKPLDAGMGKIDTPALQECIEWWDGTMSSRLVDPENSTRTIIMQRLHERDLSGHVLARGGYEHIMLPMRFEESRKCMIHTTGWEDPRKEEGELLWPERFSKDALEIRSAELGPMGVAGQEQQRPAPAEGGLIKRDWVRHYDQVPEMEDFIMAWDFAAADTKAGSYNVGQVWGRKGANVYLVDQVRFRGDFPKATRQFIAMIDRWPEAKPRLVEDAANGKPLIQSLKKEIPFIKPERPVGTKPARLNAVASMLECGNVFLPSPARAPWVLDLIEELVAFPNAANDDQVDALSMALKRYKTRPSNRIRMSLDVGLKSNEEWRIH